MAALPAMRSELQAQFSATSDPMERAMLQDALVSMEVGAKESDLQTVGSISGSVFSKEEDAANLRDFLNELKVDDGISAAKRFEMLKKSYGFGGSAVHDPVGETSQEHSLRLFGAPQTNVQPVPVVNHDYDSEADEGYDGGMIVSNRRDAKPEANQGYRLRINLKDYTREQANALADNINQLDSNLFVEVCVAEWNDSDDEEELPELETAPSADSGAMSQLE
jgi:hypothetical protein